jgi:phosphoesterase RecJ-like protein
VSTPLGQLDWDPIGAALLEGPEVLLLAHVSPDADALGSALAVGLALRQLGRPAVVSFGDDPFVVPRTLQVLPGLDLLRPPAQVEVPSVAVSFDVSAQGRLGVLEKVYEAAPVRAAIDHHASYTGFGALSVVDVTAPATAVLALELIDRLGAELTAQIAAPLYAGLLTDTGSFTYAATTAQTHLVAARLLDTGIEHDVIARRLFDDESFPALRLLGVTVARAELEPSAAGGLGLVHSYVTRLERAEHELPLDCLERVIDVLRCSSEAEVAAILKQDDTDAWRVSMRSKGSIDVSRVAAVLGGGGHRFAAGFTGGTDRGEVLAAFRAALADVPTTG